MYKQYYGPTVLVQVNVKDEVACFSRRSEVFKFVFFVLFCILNY